MNNAAMVFAFLISLNICSCESPLSEQTTSDPNSIQPQIQVLKEIDSKGTTYDSYRCDIYDQQFLLVELKDGGVKVNGEEMVLKRSILGSYYFLDDERVKYSLKTKYSFIVTLSDQSNYNATVTTHSVGLSDFIVPIEHDKSQSMIVTWKDTDSNAVMYITITYESTAGSSQGVNVHHVKIPNPKLGIFELPASEIVPKDGNTNSVDLTLHSEIDGTIDSRFYSLNRRAYSHQMITKSVSLK